ncbi:MoaD/ThiS family protein [Thermodesulfobacteriota bacterium]
MKIELRLYASLVVYMPETGNTDAVVDIKQGISIRELLEQFNVPLDSVKIIFVNGVHAERDKILKEGDRVGIFPPVAGG